MLEAGTALAMQQGGVAQRDEPILGKHTQNRSDQANTVTAPGRGSFVINVNGEKHHKF